MPLTTHLDTQLDAFGPGADPTRVPATALRTKVTKFLSLEVREESRRGLGEVAGRFFDASDVFLKVLGCVWIF